ncbi:fatty acyl-AMP ligase [Chondromyces apiculatus]|uniref:Long-chain-fatty-acid--CoA ligase n=1 Tax=Chondromyces apiculatus DSM 436 TaxID=1192034 RepID=A0A017SXT4_9BACT|nr:fatty acyl-AMP ligase [Chondromyces apiculatus]EYF01435.1 Long-chain-fatty-acid--CoA ligase [Chondromyces apiculatus DSM 436]
MFKAIQPARAALSVLREMYDRTPDKALFTFIDDKGHREDALNVRQLVKTADGIARSLPDWGLKKGDRALLVYPPGLDFVRAFVGCIMAGVIPVPVCPPDPSRLARDMPAFSALAADAGARGVLTNGAYEKARSRGLVASLFCRDAVAWPAIPWHRTDQRFTPGPEPIPWYTPASQNEPALLLYTAGATGAPRGVQVTHGNLYHEVAASTKDLRLGWGTTAVSWLPHHQSAGLIGFIMGTLFGSSANTYLISPQGFAQRPALWFETLSSVRATHTAAPDFAFDLAVRKTTPEMRKRWDLSSLRHVVSAGEPVRLETVRSFLEAFAGCGLRPEAFNPAYALAEHTLTVAVGGKVALRLDRESLGQGRVVPVEEETGRPAITCVGCGPITKEHARVRIVDPLTRRPCGPAVVGEIWVSSATKALGYHAQAALTRKVFHAKIAGSDDTTEYLRTGDLGFFHAGELFVAGRHRDTMLLKGKGVYPEHIEETVRECHAAIRRGGVVAFSVLPEDAGVEQLVVVVEVRDRKIGADMQAEVVRAVRREVLEAHGIRCDTVVLGAVGAVPKTRSGKLRRQVCRQAFLAGEVDRAETTLRVATVGRGRRGSADDSRSGSRQVAMQR